MKLRHKRLNQSDDDSATFGKYFKPKFKFHNLSKVIEMKGGVCQVRRDCREPAIGLCKELNRGCTLSFCEAHSGQRNRQRQEWVCCRPCISDKHEDICQECSSDIMNARTNFYIISLILSLLIFCILVSVVHLILQSMPDICNAASS
jgi:hypothetical protein